jgi:hypothetical protein
VGGIVVDWNLQFGRFDLANQLAISGGGGGGASPKSLESDLVVWKHGLLKISNLTISVDCGR